MQLLRAAGVKNKAETTNRAWTEFAEEGSGGASKLVDQHLFNFAAEYSMANNIVDGFFQANHYFVNGMEVSKNKFDFHSGRADKSNLGDVIVAVIDPGRTMDDELEFSEMPQILIYKAELDGPYTLPGFAGKTPLDLYSTEASDALNLGSDDCVICPKCGELDCDSHPMAKGSLVYILRADRSDKFLFAFQANLLGNATEKLIPFAPAIIRRDVKNRMSLPEEVFLIEINGDNVGDTLCLRTIRRGDTVKIVIR